MNDNEEGGVTVTVDQLSPYGRDLISRGIAQAREMLEDAPPYSWIENGQIVSPTPDDPGFELIEAILEKVFFVDTRRIDTDSVPPEIRAMAYAYAREALLLNGKWDG